MRADLYTKPNMKNQLLLLTSMHPCHTFHRVVRSLAIRIVRICSNPTQREVRLKELKQRLVERKYSKQMIERGIEAAKAVPRKELLKKVIKGTYSKREA